MTRPTFHDFKKKALRDPGVRAEYESLSAAYHLRKKLIGLRKKAGLTQEELAKRLNTQKSNISRLENVNSKISPKLSTIEEYAKAVGFKLELDFVPQKTIKPHNNRINSE
jgi:transcriptional regulator with XRE-family HTH domain